MRRKHKGLKFFVMNNKQTNGARKQLGIIMVKEKITENYDGIKEIEKGRQHLVMNNQKILMTLT